MCVGQEHRTTLWSRWRRGRRELCHPRAKEGHVGGRWAAALRRLQQKAAVGCCVEGQVAGILRGWADARAECWRFLGGDEVVGVPGLQVQVKTQVGVDRRAMGESVAFFGPRPPGVWDRMEIPGGGRLRCIGRRKAWSMDKRLKYRGPCHTSGTVVGDGSFVACG